MNTSNQRVENQMTTTKINMILVAVLETLDETPGGEAPDGVLAAAAANGVPASAGRWDDIAGLLVGAGLCNQRLGSRLEITDRGRQIAAESRAHRKAVQA